MAQQAVFDAANLANNIVQTIETFGIHGEQLTQIAQKATEIQNGVNRGMTLKSQYELMKLNAENIQRIIKKGEFSIDDLNQICFSLQTIGFNLNSIKQQYREMFPPEEKEKEEETQEEKKEKEKERRKAIDDAAEGAMAIQSAVEDEQKKDQADREIALGESRRDKVGTKAVLQAQTEMLAIIAKQQAQLQQLLIAQHRLIAVVEAKRNQKEKDAMVEWEEFMKEPNWEEEAKKRHPMTEFP